MVDIKPLTPEFDEYLKDESRCVGEAQSISFPTTEAQVRAILRELHANRTPVTVQGGRTGLAAGAVPHGGHVMNLSKMRGYLGLRQANDTFYLRVQPGLVLSQLRGDLEDRAISPAGWDAESRAALDALVQAQDEGREFFFPTDPTETSATIGGMVACNASGARSYRYGPIRPHVSALRVVLADGDVLALRRDDPGTRARGRTLDLLTEGGHRLHVDVPTYQMPQTKNASGYFAADDMDAIDLFIGSDGTLGVITEIELELSPQPAVIWGVSCFFTAEEQALDFTVRARAELASAAAFEFFDADALAILRRQKADSAAFSALPAVPDGAACCIYVELRSSCEQDASGELFRLGALLEACGGNEELTWVGRTAVDREQQRFFRHAVPESVNMLIDERRKTDPTITKLGSDMSVPDERLHDVMRLYRETLGAAGLQTAIWGHIGNNHLHVNVLPRDAADHARGKELYQGWAQTVSEMGGAVSAEHGVGKLKRDFLRVMYGEGHVLEMARAKRQLDPFGQLGRGTLFSEDVLEAAGNPAAGGCRTTAGDPATTGDPAETTDPLLSGAQPATGKEA